MMKFSNPFKSATEKFITAEAENALYEKAANDIEANIIDKGIWTKAFARAKGDEAKQKAIYIELMVDYYTNLIKAGEELAEILKTKEEKEFQQKYKQKKEQEKKEAEYKMMSERQKKEQNAEEYWRSPEGIKEQQEENHNAFIVIIFPFLLIAFALILAVSFSS